MEIWIVIITLLKQQIEWWLKTFAQYCMFKINIYFLKPRFKI